METMMALPVTSVRRLVQGALGTPPHPTSPSPPAQAVPGGRSYMEPRNALGDLKNHRKTHRKVMVEWDFMGNTLW